MVVDGARVYSVEDDRSYVLHISPDAFPSVVRESVDKSQKAREALGPQLAAVIPVPLAQWEIKGVTCALFEEFRPISDRPFTRYLHMRNIRPKVLSWLRGVVQLDRGESSVSEQALQALGCCPYEQLRQAAASALQRVKADGFVPQKRIMHGDLWSGNVLLDPTGKRQFTLIDWRGSNVDGFAVFDLIKFSESARMSSRDLRRELHAHAQSLNCDVGDTRIYLLAALGLIWLNLDQFPPDRFAAMALRNFRTLEAALG
jgi:hypothetical protein